jgi:TolB-like protein
MTAHAVFLSYASQDAEAAQKIFEALRTAGIEVFLDQSELKGGDAWEQKIRHEIQDCALFVPIISVHTQERLEGYFRHEWNLAIERTHHMAQQKPFLIPVVIDGTADREALVPDAFRAVQWTRLPGGETPTAFGDRIKRLLSLGSLPLSPEFGAAPIGRDTPSSRRAKRPLLAIAAVIAFMALVYLCADKFRISRHVSASTPGAVKATAAFSPPPRSIAVLPFVNMSGDKEQEYFSDGLAEELLNDLSRIDELQVSARTSSFAFKGKDIDIGTIARKLNVGAVLEGSVRRSAHTVRITAQLIDAISGFHLWSQTYDRDLGDVLKLQSDIASAVAGAL